MAKGFSLHIGINNINPVHYAGATGRLIAAEKDAVSMSKIAASNGFEIKVLKTSQATRNSVLTHVMDAAQKLGPEDFFFLSYSGHGGLLPNLNQDKESDSYDQSWCLHDGQLVDDELKYMWSLFKPNVRILVVTDSCFSGSMLELFKTRSPRAKVLPSQALEDTYQMNKAFYDKILTQKIIQDSQIQCSVLLLSSSQDNQESLDGTYNSVFTEILLTTWDEGNFNGSYSDLREKLKNRSPRSQTPQLKTAGQPNPKFLNSKPFKI